MKVLVTGGAGFLGRYILRELREAGYRPVAFQRSSAPDLVGDGYDVVTGSLLERASLRRAMEGCGAVLHVAALAGVWGRRRDYHAINVEGTREVLAVMEECGIRDLVYCSTPSVVFTGEPFRGADESLPYGRDWLCAYPETKARAEAEALAWGRDKGHRVIALRPHLIWGRGDPHLLPKVIARSQAGRLRIVGDGRNRVDITRVENAARAHLLALRALERPNAVNRAYFLSQGEPVQLWPWINELLGAVDVAPLQKRISFRAAYRIGAVAEGIWSALRLRGVPPMTRFVATELAKDHWFSIEAARRELDYQPEAYPTADGIARYAEAWRNGTTPAE